MLIFLTSLKSVFSNRFIVLVLSVRDMKTIFHFFQRANYNFNGTVVITVILN